MLRNEVRIVNFDYLKKLPDRIPTEEIKKLFNLTIELFEKKEIEKSDFLLYMDEITSRQTYTYELLETKLKNKIDNMLCSLWDAKCYNIDDVELITVLIVNLGLEKCYNKIKESITHDANMTEEIKLEIEDTINDVEKDGGDVSNPYSSYTNN